jgi:serine/threonine-protein kinase
VTLKAPPPPPVVTAKGTLVFIVRPWAEVHVDGKKIGVTPVAPMQLAVGPHQVRLVNPDLGKDITRTVTISADGKEIVKELFE